MIVIDLPEGIDQSIADTTQRLEYALAKSLDSEVVHDRINDVKSESKKKPFDKVVVTAYLQSTIVDTVTEDDKVVLGELVHQDLINLSENVAEYGTSTTMRHIELM